MDFILYIVFLCYQLGAFRLPSGGVSVIIDVVNLYLLSRSLHYVYVRKKTILDKSKVSVYLKYSTIIFVLYFGILLLINESGASSNFFLVKLRPLYPFLLILYTPVILNTKNKFYSFVKFAVLLSFLGTFVTVLQSSYGFEPMFDITRFYNIGHWNRTNQYVIPGFARVMLPYLYWVEVIFFFSFILFQITGKKVFLFIMICGLPTIFISYARIHWVGIVISLMIILALNGYYFANKTNYLNQLRNLFLLVLLVFVIGQIFSDNKIVISFNERISEFFIDTSQKSGTIESRYLTTDKGLILWAQNFYFGLGPEYANLTEQHDLSDVGYIYVLVSIGLVGFVLFINLLCSLLLFSIKKLEYSSLQKKYYTSISSMLMFAVICFFVVNQQYTQHAMTSSIYMILPGIVLCTQRLF